MTTDELRQLLSEVVMRYTVLLTPETDPDVYIAYVPVLGVVTQGDTVETALEAAGDAAFLEIMGRLDDGEQVPVEATDGIVAGIEVEAPLPARVTRHRE
jgi:predicted RNase H-like HicB family nuclease